MKLVKMKCENCGAILEVNSELDKINCNFCGAEVLIVDEATTLKRVEEAKLKARKENHEQTLKEKEELLEHEIKQKERLKEANAVDDFKKGKLSKTLLIFAAICLIVTFTRSFNFASVISFVQAGLFIAAWLMGMKIIKEPFKSCHIVLSIVGFGLIIPFFAIGGTDLSNYEKFKWEDIKMHELLPEPKSNVGNIVSNSSDDLFIDVGKTNRDDFNQYAKECKNKGYDIDIEDDKDSYKAFNKDGYYLDLYYMDHSKEMRINLDVPIKMSENAWESSTLSNMLPMPESTYGVVMRNDEDIYSFKAGNTTREQMDNYIALLKEKGFNLDQAKYDKWYAGSNKEGYRATVRYEGFNIIKIEIDAPSKEEETKTTTKEEEPKKEETKTEETKPAKSEGMRSDFKKFMDSYEKFIDSYISFMKKYNSNPSNAKLMKEFNNYMSKYNKMVSDFEKWGEKDLNTAEELYYLEVQTRVSKKLMEASL